MLAERRSQGLLRPVLPLRESQFDGEKLCTFVFVAVSCFIDM